MVAERHEVQRRMRRSVRIRIGRQVLDVAVRLAAVPEHLDEAEAEAPREGIRIRRDEQRGELVEVDAARDQQRVVRGADREHRAREVLRDRGRRAAEDAALARADEEQVGPERGASVDLERGMAAEAARVDHRAAEKQEVQVRLLQAVGQGTEVRQVAQHSGDEPDVPGRHADVVGRAERDVHQCRRLADSDHLCRRAEEPVAVERRARRVLRRRLQRHRAHEVRLLRAVALRQAVAAVVVEDASRLPFARQVARHRHRAADDARGAALARAGDGELGRRVAELREAVVADVQQALGQRARARDGEVPREVEVVARDAGLLEVRERALHRLAAPLDRGVRRLQVVAEGAEHQRRLDRGAAGVDQPAQCDHVTVALAQRDRRMDLERLTVRGVCRVRVELGPRDDALAGVGVEQHEAGVGVERARDVGDRRQVRRRDVDAGDQQGDLRARAEAVVAVPLARVDVHAARIRRHGLAHERDAPSVVGRGVLARQSVAGERQQALVRIENLAALRIRRVDGDRRRAGRSAVAAAAEGEGEGHGHRERYEPVAEAAGSREGRRGRALHARQLRPGRGRASKQNRQARAPARRDLQALRATPPSVASTSPARLAALARASSSCPAASTSSCRSGSASQSALKPQNRRPS